MKKWIITMIVVALYCFMLAGIARCASYTYDSSIDPIVFFTWEGRQVDSQHGMDFFVVKNPNQEAEIKYAIIGVQKHQNGAILILLYSYKLGEVEYIFKYDGINRYKQINPPRNDV